MPAETGPAHTAARFFPPQMKPGEWVIDGDGLVSIVLRDYGGRMRVMTEMQAEDGGYKFGEALVPRGNVHSATAREIADVLRDYDERAGQLVTAAFGAYVQLSNRHPDNDAECHCVECAVHRGADAMLADPWHLDGAS